MAVLGWPEEEETAQSSSASSSTVFVRNLPYEWTDVDLSSAFQDIGPLRRAFIVTTRTRERQSRGFGFVEFALPDDARRAVEEMDGKVEKGRRMKVELAVKDASEKPQRSSSRGTKRPRDKRETAEAADAEEMTDEPSSSAREEQSQDGREASEELVPAQEEEMEADEYDEEEEEEISFYPDAPSPSPSARSRAGLSSARSSGSSSSAVSILVSGIAPSVTSLSSLLSSHSLHPSHVLFPAPESTNKYRAARLTFPSSSLAAAAMAALSSASSSSTGSSPALRCVVLPASSLRLIIRNLPFHITVKHLLSLLSPFAPSLSAAAFTLPASTTSPILNRGFAFVQCDSVEAAEAVMAGVSGKRQWGRLLAVDWSLGKKDYKVREEMAVKLNEKKEKKKESKKRKRQQPGEEEDGDAAVKREEADSDADGSEAEADVRVKSEDEEAEPRVKAESEDGDDEMSSDEDEEATASAPSSPSSSSVSPLPQRRALLSPDDTASTLFIRNLAYDTSEQQLYDRFSSFGKLRYARIVMEKAEGEQAGSEEKDEAEVRRRSKGVAFVRYARKEDADRVLAMCAAPSAPSSAAARSSRSVKPSLLSSLPETGIVLDGRQLSVVAAVPKSTAASLSAASSSKQKQDKRNLYLAREGVVLSAAEGGEALSEEELARRERWWREKKKKLENVNYMVSRLRLSVRNLPMEADEKQLKAVFVSAARQAVKEEKRSEWERRQTEEAEEAAALARGEEVDEERRRRRLESQQAREERRRAPIALRQVKVVRDKERMTAAGVGRSKRFGFVEFTEHEHALLALRWVNSHGADAWKAAGGSSSSSRSFVLVEFALDDVRKLKEREDRQRRWEKMREQKARMLPDRESEGRTVRQEAAGSEEAEERKDGSDGAAKTQKEKKREARERGVCYKCGASGHQAKRCRRKTAATTAEQQPQQGAAVQVVKPEVKDVREEEQPRKRRRAAAAETDKVKNKAKTRQSLAAVAKPASEGKEGGAEGDAHSRQLLQQPQQAVGKKRRRGAAADAPLSKRDRKEQEAESRFDALVDAYKRQWMQAEVAGGAEERQKRTARWFDV